jgi:D-beta-D-heptose 7-phosphate kinase/D-beta-D-heptose 1-phosphate adenosyltransferase
MSPSTLEEYLRCASSRRIVVFGDLMLDHFVDGVVRRISPEAPVPIVEFKRENLMPGGAANVARNIVALGGNVSILGVVGVDAAAEQLGTALMESGIDTQGVVSDSTRPTITKMRVTSAGHQLLRLDRENTTALSGDVATKMKDRIKHCIDSGADAIVVADYAKGAVTQDNLDFLLMLARTRSIPVCIDPKPARKLNMRGCSLLTPNRKEAFELANLADTGGRINPQDDDALRRVVEVIKRDHDPDTLLITLSEAGMLLLDRDLPALHVPTVARNVFDVSGAGDTVMATYVLMRSVGASSREAAIAANHAAGVVLGKLGTALVTPIELKDSLSH